MDTYRGTVVVLDESWRFWPTEKAAMDKKNLLAKTEKWLGTDETLRAKSI